MFHRSSTHTFVAVQNSKHEGLVREVKPNYVLCDKAIFQVEATVKNLYYPKFVRIIQLSILSDLYGLYGICLKRLLFALCPLQKSKSVLRLNHEIRLPNRVHINESPLY